jgi:ATP-binding cassette subfamily B protein RaxB
MNLQQLIDLCDNLGLASRALQCPIEDTHRLALPCILHWDMNHFVVLTRVNHEKLEVNDPAHGKRNLTLKEFAIHFTGIALELTPTRQFKKQRELESMKLPQLWSKISGLKAALLKLFILTMLLQAFVLATPFYMQWVVDEVLISQDEPLAAVLALGFGLLVIISVVITSVRSWLILRLSSTLNMQIGVNLLRHLLRLPLGYFEARHIGDVVSRFGSLSLIREQMTSGMVETAVDGFMSVAVLIMMLTYSVRLTVVVLGAVTLYTLFRFASYRLLYQATEELIQNEAKEQTNFLESIRAIRSIKLFGHEAQRQGIWQNRYADVINTDIRLGKLNISFRAFSTLVFGLENVFVIYIAATLVIANSLTIGMALAFIAYKNQLTCRLANFVEQLIQFRMMRLHLDRIADIALHDEEKHLIGSRCMNEVKGRLTLENVRFRYSEDAADIIDGLNATFEAGRSVAIVGPSGCGKTTLLNLLLGLIQPTSGRILLDGQDIRQIGMRAYRQQVGAIMQDDELLVGSIADNISFFDAEANPIRIEHSAQMASIHQDITEMTMGYSALVSDRGSNLSGGQTQRLLLARALYKQPSILFMDEATSHLDMATEEKVTEQLETLKMTRVVIAHCEETISRADTIFELHAGKLKVVSSGKLRVESYKTSA